jgi:hypothetical protein
MMPVIRISDSTYAHLQRHAKPFEDSPESVIVKALEALDMMSGEEPPPPSRLVRSKQNEGAKLPQKEFRLPLLMTLLKAGGSSPAKAVRAVMESLMAPRLREGDYESVSTGDPRWWNAVCWERSELVKEGLLRDDSERGVWEVSGSGKSSPATLHIQEDAGDRVVLSGTIADAASQYYAKHPSIRRNYFVMVGDAAFGNQRSSLDPSLYKPVSELKLSVRAENCLKNEGITVVGELIQKSEEELLRVPNFGRRSFNEIRDVLRDMGLDVGMKVPGWG